MSKTVVGLFNSMAEANKVKQQMVSEGYGSQDINVVANDDGDMESTSTGSRRMGDADAYGTSSTTGTTSTTDREYTDREYSGTGTGIGEKISHFFRSLTGGDDEVHDHYASGVNSGGALLAVRVEDNQADAVAAMLQQHGARDIEGGTGTSANSTGAGYGVTGTRTGTAATGNTMGANTTGEQVIPVIEEQLTVGKREVNRGGVRVYSHMTERPAEADVTLREERINVERRPANRAATAADFQAGQGAAIELNATSEEAVVGKSSRVVEEVLVGKQSSERTESVHDTVRKTEVEVEQLNGMDGRNKGVRSSENDLNDVSNTGTSGAKDRY